jgi:hypothetical protein
MDILEELVGSLDWEGVSLAGEKFDATEEVKTRPSTRRRKPSSIYYLRKSVGREHEKSKHGVSWLEEAWTAKVGSAPPRGGETDQATRDK